MNILPEILAFFTRRKRYKPDIEWSGQSWTHNVFRFYELIFWRRVGIRAELTSAYNAETGITTYQCHSFESVFALAETYVRNIFQFKFKRIKVWIPTLSTAGGLPLPASPFLFAIAFDSGSPTTPTQGTTSWSHTCTGSNGLLIGTDYDRNISISGATYNSVSMSSVASVTDGNSGGGVYMFKLGSPATGANTLAMTGAGANQVGMATSYTGCDGSIDSNHTVSVVATSPQTASTTVVASNCWLVGVCGVFVTSSAITSNKTDRKSIAGFFSSEYSMVLSDTNGTVGTGSQSIIFSESSGSQGWGIVIASFGPVVPNTAFLTFMGPQPQQ